MQVVWMPLKNYFEFTRFLKYQSQSCIHAEIRPSRKINQEHSKSSISPWQNSIIDIFTLDKYIPHPSNTHKNHRKLKKLILPTIDQQQQQQNLSPIFFGVGYGSPLQQKILYKHRLLHRYIIYIYIYILWERLYITQEQKRSQTCMLTAMALFSGIGERAPQGPLEDNSNTWNEK